MMTRESFLEAIRHQPDDDTPRLIFADWLDEQEDPLGQFIRLQCILDPIRDDFESSRAEELRLLVKRLLAEHAEEWLKPLLHLVEFITHPGRPFTFRRGLVDCAVLSADVFYANASELIKHCPGLRKLSLFNLRDNGMMLANCPELQQITHLEIFDWITATDAEALATSPMLTNLRSIQLCLSGAAEEEAVCRGFARLLRSESCEIRLLQLQGGLTAITDTSHPDERAIMRLDEVARERGREHCRLLRPFAESFPLAGDLRHGMYSGRLTDGNLALVGVYYDDVRYEASVFDPRGHFLETRSCSEEGTVPYLVSRRESYANETDFLRGELGLEMTFIRVKEFSSTEGMSIYLLPGHYRDFLENPNGSSPLFDEEFRQIVGRHLCEWLIDGNFVIDWFNDFWADRTGVIHSS